MYAVKQIILTLGAVALSEAITCQNLKTMYSDLTCCQNSQTDTCMRQIPLCSDGVADGDACVRSDGNVTLKPRVDGVTVHLDPVTDELSAFSGDYNDLTNVPAGFSGDYNDLTNVPTEFTLTSDLVAWDTALTVSGSKFAIGSSTPSATFEIQNTQTLTVSGSRFECDGSSSALTYITDGELDRVMTEPECKQLATDLGYTYDADVSDSSVYGLVYSNLMFELESTSTEWRQVLGVTYYLTTSGAPLGTITTKEECEEFAYTYGWKHGITSISSISIEGNLHYWSTGCVKYSNAIYWNINSNTVPCGDGGTACIEKRNIHSKSSGMPDPNGLTEAECEATYDYVGRNMWSTYPSGCLVNGANGKFYYNGQQTNVACSSTWKCVFRNAQASNLGDASYCRDACKDMSHSVIEGSADFRAKGFAVNFDSGNCFCFKKDYDQLTTRSQYQTTNIYKHLIPPKGCSKGSGNNIYYNPTLDNNYGACSSTYNCIRPYSCFFGTKSDTKSMPLSLITTGAAWIKDDLVVSSDQRIKTDIVSVENALNTLRNIDTKRYSYIDKRKYNGTTLGFLAQQVKTVMPDAVKVEKGFLPNLLKRVTCTYKWNEALKMNCTDLETGRVRLFVTKDNLEKLLDLDFVNGIAVVEDVYQTVFAYGYEVEDFHTLEKNKLFALNFAATKQLDQEVVGLQEQVAELVARVKALEAGR